MEPEVQETKERQEKEAEGEKEQQPGQEDSAGVQIQVDTCWSSKPMKTIAVVSWVALVFLLGLFVVCMVEWNAATKESTSAAAEADLIAIKWKDANKTVNYLNAEIAEKKKEIAQFQSTLIDLHKLNDTLTIRWQELRDKNNSISTQIADVNREIQHYIQDNEAIKKDIEHIKTDIQHLHTEINATQHHIKGLETETLVYQITTGLVGGVLIAGVIDDILAATRLSKVRNEIAFYEPFVRSFLNLSEGHKDYELLRWQQGKSVSRTPCYKLHSGLNSLKDCVGQQPTITSIKTKTGFRFGGVLFSRWPAFSEKVKDDRAFTFSDTHAAVAPIQADHVAAEGVSEEKFVLGENDIVVDKLGGQVSTKAYTIPPPYNATTFYVNGSSFAMESIVISSILLS